MGLDHRVLIKSQLTKDPGNDLAKTRSLPCSAKTAAIVGAHVDPNTKPEADEKEFHLPWQKVTVGKVMTVSSPVRQNSSC